MKKIAEPTTSATAQPAGEARKAARAPRRAPAKKAPTARTKPKAAKPEAREGSKTSKVLDLLKRPGGVTSLGDLLERAPVAFERGFLAGESLPAPNHDVDVLRIELDAVARALGQLRGGQRRAAAEEGFVD